MESVPELSLPCKPDRRSNEGDDQACHFEASLLPRSEQVHCRQPLELCGVINSGVGDVRNVFANEGAKLVPAQAILQSDHKKLLERNQLLDSFVTVWQVSLPTPDS